MKGKSPETLQHQFDVFCYKVLVGESIDCLREYGRRAEMESLFSEMGIEELNQLYVTDEYPSEHHHFSSLGYDIAIKNALLGEALSALPIRNRDILLMYYFLDLSDEEIGELIGVYRTTIHYHRKNALNLIRDFIMEVEKDENKL